MSAAATASEFINQLFIFSSAGAEFVRTFYSWERPSEVRKSLSQISASLSILGILSAVTTQPLIVNRT